MEFPNKQPSPKPEKQETKKNIQPVAAEGLIIKAPRPVTKRFFDFLFAESPKALAGKVLKDTLVPRGKAAAEEALNGFIHGMFWGQGSSPLSSIVKGTVLRGGGINYNGISTEASALTQARAANTSRAGGGYEDLVCPSQDTAERLLAQLYDVFNQYRVVSVGDLYEMANLPVATSDNAYGWMSLDGARITKDRNGYVLALPRPALVG